MILRRIISGDMTSENWQLTCSTNLPIPVRVMPRPPKIYQEVSVIM